VTRLERGKGRCEMGLMLRECITACAALLKKNLPTRSSITTLPPSIKYYNAGGADDDGGGRKQMARRIVNVKHTHTATWITEWRSLDCLERVHRGRGNCRVIARVSRQKAHSQSFLVHGTYSSYLANFKCTSECVAEKSKYAIIIGIF